MKMVKSLLLGTAAALVALTGAQAADLPVKAKPVQYVKICSLYGAGFYYIPGTDMCLKVGGYLRVQIETGANNGGLPDIFGGTQSQHNRFTNEYGFRTRGVVTLDARNQSEYGTIRSYLNLQLEHNDGGLTGGQFADIPNIDRAFIQFAGFTFGLTDSFYNFLSFAPYNYGNTQMSGDSGALGNPVWAYTAQFGNGLSASISAESQSHTKRTIIDTGIGTALNPAALATVGNDVGGLKAPDIVGNIRVDQAWGSAQVMGAHHIVNTTYYGGGIVNGPSDESGWAIGGGLKLNIPGMPGDLFAMQANYGVGAMRYVAGPGFVGTQQGGTSIGYGILSDGVFGATPGSIDLTTGWSINGVYQHQWNKAWKTSLYGGYVGVSYNDTANANMCADIANLAVATGCDNNFSFWQVGSRTAWNPSPTLEIGLDVLYTKLNTASAGATVGGTGLAISGNNPGVFSVDDQDVWSAFFRVQRAFYP
jgi:hypothetical protein